MSDDESRTPKPTPINLEALKVPLDLPNGNAVRAVADELQRMHKAAGLGDMLKTLKAQKKVFDDISRPSGSMKKTLDDIDKQRKLIGDIQLPKGVVEGRPAVFKMPELPPNPILETNRKLEEMADKFEQMLSVMAGAAGIANDIQGHAAKFLEKFDEASTQTDKSARSAIRIGVLAIAVSVLVSFIPMVVDYCWPDKNLAALQAFTRQIADMQVADHAATQRLIDALHQNNQQNSDQLSQAIKGLVEKPLDLFPQR